MSVMTKRLYRYYYRAESGRAWWVGATREEWLEAVIGGHCTPKPPPSWVKLQGLEGRSEKQAAIIWGRHYDVGRKYAIWSQASDEDFAAVGYM